MSYIDAIHDRHKDKILVAERVNGERVLTEFDAEYVFYYEHPQGQYQSIFGDSARKFSTNNSQKFRKELARVSMQMANRSAPKIFESDINPVFRALSDHYKGIEAPELNLGFFDIEVDFDPDRGWAPTTDPFNKITAITLYLSHVKRLVTLVLCPDTIPLDEGEAICNEFQDTILFDRESDMLRAFLDLVEEADVLSGWNSTGFDIPYIVNRITRVLSKDATRALCLWNQLPREREYLKFKRKHKTYDLVGRVHLDYLELYQKHNPQQLHSYRLDYVAEVEVKENKTPYSGTLDDLYKKDFKKFIEYNRQDTMLLVKIDEKKKFIELANQVAHSNGVQLKTTMGSVALVEQAIINEMHSLGFVVPNRKPRETEEEEETTSSNFFDDDDDDDDGEDEGRTPVVGAYVADPKKGLHDEIGCVDINSLYPSTIRALNISPETLIGQVRPTETMELIAQRLVELGPKRRAEAWEGIFATLEVDHMHARDGAPLTIDFENGTTKTMSGRDLYDYVYNPKNHVCITANGTLFRTDKDGIIPNLLARWYAERKQMQGKQKAYEKRLKLNDHAIKGTTPEELELLKDKEIVTLEETKTPVDGVLTPEQVIQCKYWVAFWNQRQQARKILLNSLYGALLNEGLRFYDERMGQSVTLTGRSIVRHMNATINELITGAYDYRGDGIVYADTDSCYFSAYTVLKANPDFADFEWTRESIIALYDGIAEDANKTFPEFMKRTFNTTLDRGAIIAAGRELVASRGLFIKKKKYALLCYEYDGFRQDVNGKPGKLKAMGLDLKRADTPKFMQEFLEDLLMDLLTGKSEVDMFQKIKDFRREFKKRPGWEKGAPKKVSALTDYVQRVQKSRNVTLEEAMKQKAGTKNKVSKVAHYHAAMNWNHLCETHNDRYSMRLGDGSRVIVCKLKQNINKIDAVAYPIDEPHLPQWFKDLNFDHAAMEDTIIDKKLKNLVGVLNWDLQKTKESTSDEFFVFN